MRTRSIMLMLVICFAASCKKSEKRKHYVPANLKQLTPYTQAQVVKFSSGTNEIVSTVTLSANFTPYVNCTSCNADDIEENISITLNVGPTLFIRMFLDTRSFIFLSIMSPLDNYVSRSNFDIQVNTGQPSFFCFAPLHDCLTSVTLNGKQYFNILEVRTVGTGPTILSKAYFSTDKGLIGFSYGSGLTYTLVE